MCILLEASKKREETSKWKNSLGHIAIVEKAQETSCMCPSLYNVKGHVNVNVHLCGLLR